jgi:hypothetical protein
VVVVYVYEWISRGINFEDFDLYDAGVIVGYELNGDYKFGFNYYLLDQLCLVDVLLVDDDEEEE